MRNFEIYRGLSKITQIYVKTCKTFNVSAIVSNASSPALIFNLQFRSFKETFHKRKYAHTDLLCSLVSNFMKLRHALARWMHVDRKQMDTL